MKNVLIDRRYRHPALTLLLPILVWVAGCASPSPQKPVVPRAPDSSCAQPPAVFRPLAGGLTTVGTETTLDLATWNLEFFPLRLPGNYDCPHPVDRGRLEQTANLINILGLDIIAIQEISDPDGFDQLIPLIPGYAGLLAPEERGCNYQRPGLIYRTDQVTVQSSKLLFTGDSYAFPRSPFQVDLIMTANGRSYPLHLIVVHLKASGDSESQARRRLASAQLKTYLDTQSARDPDADYMIAGDWNDVLTDPLSTSSFPGFLSDPEDYTFLNMPLVGSSEFASHPFGGGSLIDHIMVNHAACADFSEGFVTTLRLDLLVPFYGNVSDHRPVMVQAPIFR